MSKEELNKILLNPDYAESLGVKVYVEVKDNGEKYAVLNNGEEEIELKNKTKMTFVDYIIKERSRKFLSISLMDMEKSNYKGTLEEWFSDMYTDYKILNQNKDE